MGRGAPKGIFSAWRTRSIKIRTDSLSLALCALTPKSQWNSRETKGGVCLEGGRHFIGRRRPWGRRRY